MRKNKFTPEQYTYFPNAFLAISDTTFFTSAETFILAQS
jgi:hypothetical protein